MKTGAKGYVTKTSDAEEFKNAIRAVARGDIFICSEIKRKMGGLSKTIS
jgi:DNA-binding NarL/FixJ family response regulator